MDRNKENIITTSVRDEGKYQMIIECYNSTYLTYKVILQ